MVKPSSSALLVSATIGAASVARKLIVLRIYSNQNRVALGRSINNTIDLLKVRSFCLFLCLFDNFILFLFFLLFSPVSVSIITLFTNYDNINM